VYENSIDLRLGYIITQMDWLRDNATEIQIAYKLAKV